MVEDRRRDYVKRAEFGDNMFRTMFQLAPVGMLMSMPDTRKVLRVNDKLCDITGYTRTELLDLTALDLTHPDDRAADEAHYRDMLAQSGTPHQAEKPAAKPSEQRYVRKDGGVIWVRLNSACMRDSDGKAIRTLSVVEDITAHMQAQAALRESERRLTALIDGMPDRVWLKDPQGRVIVANLAQAREMGANSVAAVIGKTLFDFRPADFARSVTEEEQDLMRSGRTLRVERQVPNEEKWFDVIKVPIYDEQGRLAGLVSIARDITERRRMEDALRESEHRLREFLDGIPARAWCKDAHGRYLIVNTREAQARGRDEASLLGKTDRELLSADVAEKLMAEDAQVLTAGETLRIERKSVISGVWSEIVKAPVRGLDGSVVGLVGVVTDISERKQSEEAVRDSESKLRALLDAIPDRAWLKDAHGHYVAVNRSAAAFFGMTPAQMTGKTAQDLFPPEVAKRLEEEERQALLNMAPLRLERQFGGQGRWYETVKLPIQSADGLAAGLVSISRDVTERRQVEDDMRAAKAAAEQANRAKGEFLSHMSHEMRTPMNAILGFAEVALLEQPDANQCEHLEKIVAATKSLLRVVDDVLDFERIDSGKLELETLDFRIEDVLQNVRDVVERAATAKGLALRFKVGDNMPRRLKGDAGRVSQVLMNLCANAVKFTSRGFIEVVVEAEKVSEARVTLHFEVRDTGIGMSPEAQARLFQPFMQADTSTTRRYGGTGLGLAICKRLIELMGGRIWIESAAGEGTVVFFTIDCALGDTQAPAAAVAREGLPEEAVMLYGKRVLVVDDHPINRMLMAKLLKLANAEAVPAENGLDALRVLQQEGKVDLVLMDLRMPEMDGYEATRRIRADDRWAKLPIVAVTASAATYERARCLAVGMNDVIVKPIHQSVFFPVVAAAMKAAAG